MRNSTLVHIDNGDSWLMLHRVKKVNDVNKDKWIGVGGGFWENESPEDCARREVYEETGLTVGRLSLRAVVTFVIEGGECEQMFVFTTSDYTGKIKECDEGVLEWVPKKKLYDMDIWEGDKIFLRKIENPSEPFFTLKLVYDKNGKLLESIMNGEQGRAT